MQTYLVRTGLQQLLVAPDWWLCRLPLSNAGLEESPSLAVSTNMDGRLGEKPPWDFGIPCRSRQLHPLGPVLPTSSVFGPIPSIAAAVPVGTEISTAQGRLSSYDYYPISDREIDQAAVFPDLWPTLPTFCHSFCCRVCSELPSRLDLPLMMRNRLLRLSFLRA